MDIRCPECQTLYEFDDSRLESGSATLKCRKCQHMFRLGEDSKPSREDEQRWMVRDADKGDVLYFNAFDTLHRWIVERKVDRSWQISRTGDKWTELGEIGEFRPIFQVVDNVSSIEGESAVRKTGGAGPSSRGSGSQGGRVKKDTLDQFHEERNAADASASESQPTSAARPGASDSTESPAARSSDQMSTQSSSRSSRPSPREQSTQRADRKSSPHAVPNQSRSEDPAAQSGSISTDVDGPGQSGEIRQSSQKSARVSENSSGGAMEGASRPGQDDPEASNVQLDTGMFGAEDDPADRSGSEDEWAFEGEDVRFDETTQVSEDDHLYEEDGGRRWSVVVTVALVLSAAGGAYLWMYQRDRVRSLLGMSEGSSTVDSAEEKKAREETPESAGTQVAKRSYEEVGEALSAARSKLGARQATLFANVHAEASGKLVEAFDAAVEKAERKAEAPKTVTAMLGEANRKLQSGAQQQARQIYHDVIDEDPTNSEAITGLGWSLLALGNPDAARAQFEKALHHNPTYGDAYIGLGQAHRRMSQYREALEAYKTYLEKLPNGSQASIAEHQRNRLQERLGIK